MKQYKLCWMFTSHSVGHKAGTTKSAYIYTDYEEAKQTVKLSNKDQSDTFGIGYERMYYYLEEIDVTPERHWALFRDKHKPVVLGVDNQKGNRNTVWGGSSTEVYASGDTYGEALNRLGLHLKRQGI